MYTESNKLLKKELTDRLNKLLKEYYPSIIHPDGIVRLVLNTIRQHKTVSMESPPVEQVAAEEFKKFLVVQDHNDKFEVWTKEQYERYVSGAAEVGAGSAYKVVTHFNGDEDLIKSWIEKERSTPSGEDLKLKLEAQDANVEILLDQKEQLLHRIADLEAKEEKQDWSKQFIYGIIFGINITVAIFMLIEILTK